MPCQRDVIYVYDGGLEGMLCCIFEEYEKKERPAAIRQPGAMKTALQFGFGDGEDPGTALGVSD